MEKTIAEFEKGEDLIRVQVREFRKRHYVDVREFYMSETGEWKPTKKGLSMSLEMAEQIHEAVGTAIEELKGAVGE
jgi:hypothetical protein